MFTESTRFKLAVGLLVLYFVQGIIKAIWGSFPLIECMAGEGIIAGYYFTVRTVQDTKQATLDNAVLLKEQDCNKP